MAKLLQERAEVEKRLAELIEFSSDDSGDEKDFPRSDVLRQVNYLPLAKVDRKNKNKKKDNKKKEVTKSSDETKPVVPKSEKTPKPITNNVIMITNIPHGFYEPQLFEFLKQFGKVKGLHLSRSKKTGRSRNYAFIKFFSTDVAQIVAKAIDGYMVGDKTLHCNVIQNPEKFKHLRLSIQPVDVEKVAERNQQKLKSKYRSFASMSKEKLLQLTQSLDSAVLKKERELEKIFGVSYKIPVTDIKITVTKRANEQRIKAKKDRKNELNSKREIQLNKKGTKALPSNNKLASETEKSSEKQLIIKPIQPLETPKKVVENKKAKVKGKKNNTAVTASPSSNGQAPTHKNNSKKSVSKKK